LLGPRKQGAHPEAEEQRSRREGAAGQQEREGRTDGGDHETAEGRTDGTADAIHGVGQAGDALQGPAGGGGEAGAERVLGRVPGSAQRALDRGDDKQEWPRQQSGAVEQGNRSDRQTAGQVGGDRDPDRADTVDEGPGQHLGGDHGRHLRERGHPGEGGLARRDEHEPRHGHVDEPGPGHADDLGQHPQDQHLSPVRGRQGPDRRSSRRHGYGRLVRASHTASRDHPRGLSAA
jgi:hypothetical protein